MNCMLHPRHLLALNGCRFLCLTNEHHASQITRTGSGFSGSKYDGAASRPFSNNRCIPVNNQNTGRILLGNDFGSRFDGYFGTCRYIYVPAKPIGMTFFPVLTAGYYTANIICLSNLQEEAEEVVSGCCRFLKQDEAKNAHTQNTSLKVFSYLFYFVKFLIVNSDLNNYPI